MVLVVLSMRLSTMLPPLGPMPLKRLRSYIAIAVIWVVNWIIKGNYLCKALIIKGGSSSVAERQLPKLNVAGSIPVSRSNPPPAVAFANATPRGPLALSLPGR